MVKIEEVAKRVARKDGQIDWDSLPGMMKFEYVRQVEMVLEAAAELGREQASDNRTNGEK